MSKVSLQKSCFYKDQAMEVLYFRVEGEQNEKFCLESSQEKYGTSRDEVNAFNKISEINYRAKDAFENFDATTYTSSSQANEFIDQYLASQGYDIDEKKIEKELEKYVAISHKMEDTYHYSSLLLETRKIAHRIETYDKQTKENSLDYMKEYIEERKNPTGKDIKSVDDRRTFWARLTDKHSVDDDFINFEYLTDRMSGTKYMDWVSELYQDGPEIAKIDEQREKINKERTEIHKEFDSDKRVNLRKALFQQYEANLIREAMQAKYYDETKDISIFLSAKEKEEFDKISVEDLIKKHGTDLITTYKGAVLISHKLHEKKSQGKDIREDLKLLKDVAKSAKSTSNTPNNNMNVRYYLFTELKKDYQKFAPDDNEFRALIEELAPTRFEQASINGLIAETNKSFVLSEGASQRVKALKELQETFTEDSNEIITGKFSKQKIAEKKALIVGKKKEENINQAIKRVKAKYEEAKKTGDNISGVVIADDIAKRVQEGFDYPTDKKQQEKIEKNLRQKRATNREILKAKQTKNK